MKILIFLYSFSFLSNVLANGSCVETIKLIQKDDFVGASLIFENDCKHQNLANSKISISEKDRYLSIFITNFNDCINYFLEKNRKEISSCLYSLDLKDAIELVDSISEKSFMKEYKKWDAFYNKDKYEAEALAEKEKRDFELKQIKDLEDRKTRSEREKRLGIDIYSSACQIKNHIKFLTGQIEREKKIGSIGGYEDATKLNKIASQIVDLNLYGLDPREKEHVERFGKPIDYNKCKCNDGALGIDCKK